MNITTQHDLFGVVGEIETRLNEAVKDLRMINKHAPEEALLGYGGDDYHRHLSLAITNIQQGVLWIGGSTSSPLDDEEADEEAAEERFADQSIKG